jgi:branched-chain amino acid aminotransferase
MATVSEFPATAPTEPGVTFDPADGIAYIDGDYRPLAEARISVLDFGFMRSDVTFDTAKVLNGRFFRLDLHLDRFMQSCATLRLRLPVGRDEVGAIMTECVRRAGLRDALVKPVCTRGMPAPGSRDPRDATPNFFVYAQPYSDTLKKEQQDRGLNLVIASTPRISPEAVDPRIKNYNRLDFVAGLFEAYDRGGDSVLLPDEDGNVTEGPGFNVFVIRGGEAATPHRGMLEGITRGVTLALCEELQIRARIRPVAADELRAADEVFITSTAGGIMPVTRIDGQSVGDGRPGPRTTQIRDLYLARHDDPAWTTEVTY